MAGRVRLALILTASVVLVGSGPASEPTSDPSAEDTREGSASKADDWIQDAFPPPPPPRPPITITTPRRPVELGEVPMAVTVFTAEDLAAAGAETTMDLQHRTPGFVFKMDNILGQPYIRGVGSSLLSAGADPSVATFVDDVYRARSVSAVQRFYDIERVEIARGPLGSLYGRNALGGAVRIFSKPPVHELAFESDVAYGRFDELRFRGALNVPVVEDRLAARLSGLFSKRDGYSRNVFLGEDLDDDDFWSVRGQLLAEPTPDLQIRLIADYTHQDDSRNLAPQPDPDCCVNGGVLFGGTVPSDPRKVRNDVENGVDFESRGASAKLVWNLGAFELSSISAWRKTEFDQLLDLDLTEAPFGSVAPRERSRTVSQELQLAWDGGGPLTGLAGLYYLHEDALQELDTQLPLFGLRSQPRADVDTDAFAVFGEARYRLADAWRFTAGLRVSHEARGIDYREIVSASAGPGGGTITQILRMDDEERWTALTPRFVAEFAPRDGLLAYFSVTRGFKAGGYNTTVLQPAFDPEHLWSYELGVKADFWDQRARLAASAFWYDYDDLQLQTVAPQRPTQFPIVVNAAKATIRGLELELSARPLAGLELELEVAFLDAEFDDFVSVDTNNPGADPDRSGGRLPQAPEWSGNASLAYTWGLGAWGSLVARVAGSYRSETFYNAFEDSNVKQSGYGLLDASLLYTMPGGHWTLSIVGRNLTDRLYAQNVVRGDPVTGALRFWGPPRTWSVQLAARF